ncbi:unnamed protein product [Rotaria socialis]|uniref:LamG domain-containing protein n=1 Tax=Rotaria socialis TaxID=392032 RepID=A0A818F0W9_9BILA|nr:unnamed protein product [Rotaria socialis]
MNSSDNIIANLWNGGPVTTPDPILPLNAWHHIGFTYSSTNGVCFSSFGMGCSPGYGGSFTGALNEFFLYSRELASSEIFTLANLY